MSRNAASRATAHFSRTGCEPSNRRRAARAMVRPPVESLERRALLAAVSISDAVVTEGNAGTTNAVFTVTLHQPGDQVVQVNYATSNNTATTPDDYAVQSGTLTFNPGGPTTQTITVPVVGDTLQENNELFFVTLSSPSNATVVGRPGRGYIADDDQSFLTIHNLQVAEGTGGTTNAVLTVTRSGSTAGTTNVNYATNPGTATSPADFTTGSGTLVFAPGVTTQTITVPIATDALDETNETFSVSLSAVSNSTLSASSSTITIIDDDASSFAINGVAVREGTVTGKPVAVLTVVRQGALGGAASVSYATSNSSATVGEDYVSTNGTLQFAPNEASKQIIVPISPDAVQEADERFSVTISGAQNASIAEPSAEVWIIDDDASSFVVEGAAVTEGDAGTTPLTFTVRRHGSLAGSAQVNYATSNSSATAPGDYAQANGTLTFNPNEAVKTVTVQVVADNAQEPVEALSLTLSNSTNGTIAETQAQGVIFDDDESYFTIANITNAMPEGGAGTTGTARFLVTRHGSLDGAAQVNYATTNGTAATPSDYAVSNGTLQFAPGESTKEVSITTAGDDTAENNEYFGVQLASPQNATVAENVAYVWLVNDDGAVNTSYFFPRDAVVSEGDSGAVEMTFLVQRLGAVGGAASVNYSFNNGTAVQGQDFAGSAGTLQFAANETQKSFTVSVTPDGIDEATETFSVSFTGAVGGTVADGSVQGMIVDDDEIGLYVNDVSTSEGDGAAGHDVRFTVTRAGETSGATTVNYTTSASTATSPGDFQLASGTLNFAAGETTKEIVVRVVGDAVQEDAEQYFITLSAPTNGTIVGSTGTGTIIDNDEYLLYVNDVAFAEGTGGTTEAVFTVTRFGSTAGTSSVQYAATNSTATSPGDFAVTTGTLTFGPGETTKQVAVPVATDSLQETSEAFTLNLSSLVNATLVGSSGNARIIDDDTSYVAVTGATVTEGSSGATTNASVTVTRYGSTAGTSSVELRTGNSSATTPGDYGQVITTVNFLPGETTKVVTIPVAADTLQEQVESFTATLSSPTNTTVVGGSATVYIVDDDDALLYVTSDTQVEGNPGAPGNLVFTVHRLGSLAGTTIVNYAAAASSATTPADFPATSGTLTFNPGVATRTITVPATADFIRETFEESFFVNLSGVQNATVVNSQAQGSILDDDPAPAVTQVYVSGSTWAGNDNLPNVTFKEFMAAQGLGSVDYGFAIRDGADQLLTIPWSNVNRVSITFSQDVIVDRDDLEVRGTNVANYAFLPGAEGFQYNAATRTATWTFTQNLVRDRMILDLNADAPNGVRNSGGEYLDGEWNSGGDSYPSGNGLGGGDFKFRLNALRADADRNLNRVNAADQGYVKARVNRTTNAPTSGTQAAYTIFADINGDSRVNAADQGFVKSNINTALPAAQPAGLFGDDPISRGSHRGLLA